MDYNEKYNKALEQARDYHSRCTTDYARKEIEAIFPELKDSDDEMIRKALAQLIITDIEELIKSADSRTYFSGVKEYLEDVRQFAYNKGLVDAKEKYKKEQQPAEWSEEDEKMLKDVYESLYAYQCDIRAGIMDKNALELLKIVDKEKAWLKSLRPQPKQEWSEEDNKMSRFIGNAISADDASTYLESKGIQVIDAHVWLEELKERVQPQPRWMPSEEQMEALMLAIEGKWEAIMPTGYMSRRLEDLYEGLANTFQVECKLEK